MLVGFMRNLERPNNLCELTAKVSKYYGIDIIYLRPKDVDTKKNIVKGKMLVSGKWQEVEKRLPKLIDISPYCFINKNRKVIKYLKKNSYLTDNRENLVDKEMLQERLLEDEYFSNFVIPTKKLIDFYSLEKAFNQYKTIVLKPVSGERGKGIYILTKKADNYLVGYQKSEKLYSKKELEILYEEKLSKGYIMQKYIASKSKQGDPFDCRVHYEKNGQGKWEIAKMYIRIGIGQKVISNMNQGGGMSAPKKYLEVNFGDNGKKIYDKIRQFAKRFPYKFEELRKTDVMTIGIDIGVDENGDVYIFEANGAPTTKYLRAEVVNFRSQYYKYLLDNKVDDALKRKRNIKLKELTGRKMAPSDRLIIKEAYERGIDFKVLPKKSFQMLYEDISYKIKPGMISLSYNSTAANKITKMKEVTSRMLRRNGFYAPENAVFSKTDVERAWEWAKPILPIVLKPSDGIQGRLVFVRIDDYDEFKYCFEKISEKHDTVLVEEFKTGDEYRFTYVKNKIVAVAKRIPANIVGDGYSTINELIEQKNKERKERKNPIHKLLRLDEETERVLHKQNLSYNSVPTKDTLVFIRNNSNISTGGDAVDVTNEMKQEVKETVRKAIRSIPGIKVCGADVLIDGESITILEINNNPMISIHHFPWKGKRYSVASDIVDAMFPNSMNRK